MIDGTCQSGFSEVRDAFEQNFEERDEVGASVCIKIDGETVVDLWGGVADQETEQPWQEDTISVIWSATKGATALCAHILADRGKLDLKAPVAEYWPEFAQEDKDDITIEMLLNHQAGLPAIRKSLPEGAFYDWSTMVEALAKEEPFWTPGIRVGYHGLTFGWLIGEVVRRVSGRSLGEFFQSEVAEPLDLDFWIGLPEEQEDRVAPMIQSDTRGESEFMQLAMEDPESIPGLLMGNTGGFMNPDEGGFNSREAHAAEIPAAGGITNARGLAGLYAPLACDGSIDGVSLLDADAISRMTQTVSAVTRDASLKKPNRFSLGYVKSLDNRNRPTQAGSFIVGPEAFGHPGFGGTVGFADPDARMSFGYTMTRMGSGSGLNERGQSLVNAAYRSLGYTSNEYGVWQ